MAITNRLRPSVRTLLRQAYAKLAGYATKGATIKTTRLSDEFNYEAYETEYQKRSIRLCAIEPNGKVRMFTSLKNIQPKSDWRIVSLITQEKTAEVNLDLTEKAESL